MGQGLILFAHGARDAEWAEPFERLLDLVRQRAPQTQVRLAYLELMRPDIAAGKAWGALGLGFGTRNLAGRAKSLPQFFGALAELTVPGT